MEYVYLAIIWLVIMVIVQEVRICKLKDRSNKIMKAIVDISECNLNMHSKQREVNDSFVKAIRVLSGIKED